MKLPNLTQVQFQSAAQSQEFDPLQLPDPNPQLQENLATIQRSFKNLQDENKLNAEALYSQPGKMTTGEVIGQMAELLPQAVGTLSELQNVDVAIQMARADDQYYKMLREGLIPQNGELLAIEQQEEMVDGKLKEKAAEVSKTGVSYDIPRGILNFSNHGEFALRRRLVGHMMQNVYPEWMKTQLQINDTEVPVPDENGNMVMVRINQKELPDYQFDEVMSHLRTAFMGHDIMADANKDGVQEQLAIGFGTDAQIKRAYSRETRGLDGERRFKSAVTNLFDQIKVGNYKQLGKFYNDVESMWSKDGKTLTNTPTLIFKRLTDYVGTVALNGAELPIGELIDKGVFEDGTPFAARAPLKAATLGRIYKENITKYRNNKAKADLAELRFESAQFHQNCLEKGGCSTAEYIDRIDNNNLLGAQQGINPTEINASLQRGMRLASLEGADLAELDRQARIALETGTVSLDADYAQNPVIYGRYKAEFEKQTARKESEAYKFGSKQVERLIKNQAEQLVDPQGDLKWMAAGANNFYQKAYDSRYKQLQAQNENKPEGQKLTDEQMAEDAENYVTTMWQAHQQNDKHIYYVNPKNGTFPNYPKTKAEAAKFNERMNMETLATEGKTTQGIALAIKKTPMLVYDTPTASLNALNAFIRTGVVDKTLHNKRTELNRFSGTMVIPKPELLLLAAAVGYGHITPEQAKQIQSPLVRRAQSAAAAQRANRDSMGITGIPYQNPAQYTEPVQNLPVRAAFEKRVVGTQIPGNAPFPPQIFRRAPKGQHRFLVTVGINEGNRTADGGYTQSWSGHIDPATGGPAKGRLNRGSVSYGGFRGTPTEADAIFNRKFIALERAYAPKLAQLGVQHGTTAYEALMFNIADLEVQAPLAVNDFVKQIPALLKQGLTMETIGKARADSFIVDGKLHASGFSNNYNTLLRDQEARAMTFQLLRRGR